MNINFILLGQLLKKKDDYLSKQRQFLILYRLVKMHH
uniref:Uncharacterized protein n=1 Tax=viral metagenome TaxID=1070528 RepID=A0A6C0BA69_9ZZZZ